MKPALIKSFSKNASTYDLHSHIQKEVNQRLLSRLSLIKHSPDTILDIGSGTGELSILLGKNIPYSKIYSTDICLDMIDIHKAKKDLALKIVADAEQLPFKQLSFDTIISSLTFHWCNVDDFFFSNFLRLLKPGGLILFSVAGPETLKEFRRCPLEISNKLKLNSFLDMHHYGDFLLRSLFEDPVVDSEEIVLEFSSFNSLMNSLRKTGTNIDLNDSKRQFISKNEYKMIKASTYNAQKKTYELTYEIIYGYAIKSKKNPINPSNFIPIKEAKKD